MLKKILWSVLIGAAVFLAVALGLAFWGGPGEKSQVVTKMSFEQLKDLKARPAPFSTYKARDGSLLPVREYPAQSRLSLVLIHGSAGHGRYLATLAGDLAKSGAARVYTPDLRGHGQNPARRGDIDYRDQLTDDLADLLSHIERQHPGTRVAVGGHSSGGGLALRFAGAPAGRRAAGYLLLAPFLKYNAPNNRPDSGGWARPYTPRIIGLAMLNVVGVTWLNHLPAVGFNLPAGARGGAATPEYSFRMMAGLAPGDYRQDLAAIKEPLLVLVGGKDEVFLPGQYRPIVAKYDPKARVEVLPGVTHLGLVLSEKTVALTREWLADLR